MMYRSRAWRAFRLNMIAWADSRCERCFRNETHGVVLQVHHKAYVRGRAAHEYAPSDVEVICKGCHAEEHGIIRPKRGWLRAGEDDAGDLSEECEVCGTEIRYVVEIWHGKWGVLFVGRDCAERMCEADEAISLSDLKRRARRRAGFLASPRWKQVDGCTHCLRQNGSELCIRFQAGHYWIVVGGRRGKWSHRSSTDARSALFDLIESGELQKWIERQRVSARPARSARPR